MAPDGVQQIEHVAPSDRERRAERARACSRSGRARAAQAAAARAAAAPSRADAAIEQDVEQLAMSTLSFQDYVRERMLKRREAARERPQARAARRAADQRRRRAAARRRCASADAAARRAPSRRCCATRPRVDRMPRRSRAALPPADDRRAASSDDDERAALDEGPDRGALRRAGLHGEAAAPARARRHADAEAARLRLLAGADPQARPRACRPTWPTRPPGPPACSSATCCAAEREPALEDAGGVYALIGATGVGKTTSTAKLAAAFADQARRGATSA